MHLAEPLNKRAERLGRHATRIGDGRHEHLAHERRVAREVRHIVARVCERRKVADDLRRLLLRTHCALLKAALEDRRNQRKRRAVDVVHKLGAKQRLECSGRLGVRVDKRLEQRRH